MRRRFPPKYARRAYGVKKGGCLIYITLGAGLLALPLLMI